MIILGIGVSFIMFSIIVLLHEYGHYKTARFFGIHIEEFGLGIPPRAKKLWTNKTGTLFSLNWIPLGGFVKISGESEVFYEYVDVSGKKLPVSEIKKYLKNHKDIYTVHGKKISLAERKYLYSAIKSTLSGKNFYEKNIFIKTGVLLAGVIMNFLLAGIIFSTLFFVGVQPVGINTVIPTNTNSKIIPTLDDALSAGIISADGLVLFPIENSIAEKAGVMQGDIILSINNILPENSEEFIDIIQKNINTEVSLSIQRDNTIISLPVIPNEEGKIGSYISPNIIRNTDFIYKYGAFASLKYGFLETYYQSRLTLQGLGMLIKNIFTPETPEDRTLALDQVAGPIGIVGIITQSLEGGFVLLIILGALISVNLGVFNLLPIPALDGGRILLLWIRSSVELVIGKNALSGKIENFIHIFFFMLLIALSILIAYNDIIKLIFQ